VDQPPYIVLLVEDDEPLHQMSKELLEEFGYEVVSANNGVEAVTIIDNLDQRLDIVFSDVKMPDNVSGFEVAKHLAKVRPSVPILLTTGYSEEILKLESDYVAVDIITKPYMPKKLNTKIREVIESRKG
jgi:CheY-like chemotaxis protein